MFHKQYYPLQEVAKKLDTDVESLLHAQSEGALTMHYVQPPSVQLIATSDEITVENERIELIKLVKNHFAVSHDIGLFLETYCAGLLQSTHPIGRQLSCPL